MVQRIEQIRYLPNFAHRSSPCEAHRGPADFSTMTLTGHGEKGMHATVDGKKTPEFGRLSHHPALIAEEAGSPGIIRGYSPTFSE